MLHDYTNPHFQPHTSQSFFEETSAHISVCLSWDNLILKTNYSQNKQHSCCSHRPVSPKAVTQSQQGSSASQESQPAHTLRKTNVKTKEKHQLVAYTQTALILPYGTAQMFGSRRTFLLSFIFEEFVSSLSQKAAYSTR